MKPTNRMSLEQCRYGFDGIWRHYGPHWGDRLWDDSAGGAATMYRPSCDSHAAEGRNRCAAIATPIYIRCLCCEDPAVLCCAVLCCAVLCCAVLCWLCCSMLCQPMLSQAIPRHAMLCCAVLWQLGQSRAATSMRQGTISTCLDQQCPKRMFFYRARPGPQSMLLLPLYNQQGRRARLVLLPMMMMQQ